jgi:hypothetical protein
VEVGLEVAVALALALAAMYSKHCLQYTETPIYL